MIENSCLDCGKKIKHSGRCLSCNYKRKYGFAIRSKEAKEFAKTRTDKANCVVCGKKIEAGRKHCKECSKKIKELRANKKTNIEKNTEISEDILDILKQRIKDECSEEDLIKAAKETITKCQKCERDIVNNIRQRQTICMACAYLAKNGKEMAAAKNWPKNVSDEKLIDIGARVLAKKRLDSSE